MRIPIRTTPSQAVHRQIQFTQTLNIRILDIRILDIQTLDIVIQSTRIRERMSFQWILQALMMDPAMSMWMLMATRLPGSFQSVSTGF